jgi:O-Antigen ligase
MKPRSSAILERVRGPVSRLDLAGIGAWLVPAVLIVYLGLNNGGYDVVERSEVGIAVWWLVLLGTAIGLLPVAGGTPTGRIMFGLLAAFAVWSALSLSWTESAERTSIEVVRTATYLGAFALALAIQGSGRQRQLLNGAAAGIAAVGVIAILARLEPSWFPDRTTGEYLPGIEIERLLAYPLNYSTGMATLAAMGLPLLLCATSSARTIAGSALAAAGLPVLFLVLWMTHSGLALPAAAVALGVFIALAPHRLPKLVTLLVAGAGAATLVVAIDGREALERGLATPAAESEGDAMLPIVLAVCAVAALAQAAIRYLTKRALSPGWVTVPPRAAGIATAGAIVLVLVAGTAAGAPAEVSERWDSFRGEAGQTSGEFDPSSSGRYKFWQSALDANAAEPWLGIGPGTFEFWWARDGGRGFVRDAHSTFVEALAELGIVGFALVLAFAGGVLGLGVAGALRAPPERRVVVAAATGGCAAFTGAAAGDWAWELGVLPVAYLTLAAIAVGGSPAPAREEDEYVLGPVDAARRYGGRVLIVVLGVMSIVAIAIPMGAAMAVERSRADVSEGRLDDALYETRTAQRLQPYAASPWIQEALIYERAGDLDAAAAAAASATQREATNWRHWLILSRIEALRDRPDAALDAYREAVSLNPEGLPNPNAGAPSP